MTRLSFVFCLLGLALLLFAPVSAWALTNSPSTPDCTQQGEFYKNYSQNMANTAMAKRNAIYSVHNQLAKIQTDLFSCLDGIDLGYDLGPFFHDPLGFIENALIAAFWTMIENLLDTVCHMIVSAVNSIVNQIVSSVMSLANFMCIPAINLGFNLNPDLGLPHIPCNGTPLIPGSALITHTPAPTGSSSWRMFGRTSQ